MLLLTIALTLLVISLLYAFLVWNSDYWKKRGVTGPKPLPFLGNFPNILTQKQHQAIDIDDIYQSYKKDQDFVGIFNIRNPQLLVLCPKLIRRIFIADFKHFHDNEVSQIVDEKSDFIFANSPFSLTGEKWKERRTEVTPALTISRIKSVYPVTRKICQKMLEYIEKETRLAPKDGIDIKDICLRYTSEVVTDCVLGLNADSFADKPSPILAKIKNLFDFSLNFVFYNFIVGLIPILKSFYKIRLIPKPAEDFFKGLVHTAIKLRKAQVGQQDRADFFKYILELQEKKNLSNDHMTALVMTFLLDGFDTMAGVAAHCLYLLARTPGAQTKLRAEIQQHLDKNGEIDFDTLNELPYLDACMYESIRIFPPGFFSAKVCTEPIELTNSKNGHTVKMEKGNLVYLPLYSIMADDEYYPNAKEFQPERFLPENGGVKKYREEGLYYGFGDGPRICLGMRFALAQTKAAVVEIIKNYDISLNTKTRTDNKLDPKNFLCQLDGGMWLNFKAVNYF